MSSNSLLWTSQPCQSPSWFSFQTSRYTDKPPAHSLLFCRFLQQSVASVASGSSVRHSHRRRKARRGRGVISVSAGAAESTASTTSTADAPPSPAAQFRSLYPAISSHQQGSLKVSNIHTIYYEVFGNPDGKPAVFLHGGPGAGCTATHSRFFDPSHYRIVLLDQRGCGKSTPKGCLEENTTWDLVEDLEKLRTHLGINKWLVMGGSWGVTLALAYAQTHPTRVAAVVLRGICLMRRREIDWFYRQGADALFPFGWEHFEGHIAPEDRGDLLAAYYKKFTGDDLAEAQSAASAWMRWEMGLSFFSTQPLLYTWDGKDYRALPSPSSSAAAGGAQAGATAPVSASPGRNGDSNSSSSSRGGNWDGKGPMPSSLAQARLESHYSINGAFLKEDQLLKGVDSIRSIPAVAVQGRYDFVCPLKTAFDLHKAWPEMELRIVPNAGHSMYEQGILHELVNATDRFRDLAY